MRCYDDTHRYFCMIFRKIQEGDVGQVISLYKTVYGDAFPFQEFYDATWVKKGVFDEKIVWIVAEDAEHRVAGTAAVMLDAGDADDLIGEFGRLVVNPQICSKGVGTELIHVQLGHIQKFIEWGFAECRTVHSGAQKIFERAGFHCVGFEPLAYQLGPRRESMALMARLFGHAAKLRKNNPHVIPGIFPLGCQAMQNLGLEPDLIVDKEYVAYPYDESLTVDSLPEEEAYRLLRIGRGRAWEREVFGGTRLEYGYLKLSSSRSEYLVAKRGEVMTGAVGYSHDHIDSKIRIFELIAVDNAVKGTLLKKVVDHITVRYKPIYIEISVNAHAPRMQKTLEMLGFFPVAYCPSMVFEATERLDAVKMVKLSCPWSLGRLDLLSGPSHIMELVAHAFEEINKGQTIIEAVRSVELFQGLGDQEVAHIRDMCREKHYDAGEPVFKAYDRKRDLYLVLEGVVAIVSPGDDTHRLAEFREGESFGEMSLIDDEPRSAGAVCTEPSRLLALSHGDFHHLINEHPDLGKTLLLNLSKTLSRRLRTTDRYLEWLLRPAQQ